MEKISSEIIVAVHPTFQPKMRGRDLEDFIFTYDVYITNSSKNTIQLLSRRWEIFDTIGVSKIIEGEGVVGEQPIIEPGASYHYQSAVAIKGESGSMKGHYFMRDMEGKYSFLVEIPKFVFTVPYKLN